MKKIKLLLVSILLSATTLFAQPISDMGVIPIGVTLNSILRLTVVSGGNIEFVVNTFDQFENGIAASAGYETKFTVASSIEFHVDMYAEGAFLLGQLNSLNKLDIRNIGYTITATGGGADGTDWDLLSGLQILEINGGTHTRVVTDKGISAGNAAKNAFTIAWELATTDVLEHANGFNPGVGNGVSLLDQNLGSDRYVVNVFLSVVKI